MMINPTSRKIKILHLISGDLWAGAEVMACNLLGSLPVFADIDIEVVLLNKGRLADELMANGLRVHIIDENRYSFWQIFKKVLAIIGDSPPDIIHAHRYKENFLAFLISRRWRKIKLISTLHGLPEIIATHTNIASRFKAKANFYILSRYFHKTVAVSADIKNILVNHYGFTHNNVEIIHNGIRIPPAQVHTHDADAPFVIGSSGRLFPVKDFPLMIEIANALIRSEKGAIRFELAGDGPERSTLEALIQHYGLRDRFILRGHQDDMDSFYRGLSIYLNTSTHEGIPMTILEAMAHNLPIIAPAVGGIGEIFQNGSEGFLIAGRNPHDFAKKCLLLFEDKNRREQMAQASRKRAESTFSAGKMAENYRQTYFQTTFFRIPTQ